MKRNIKKDRQKIALSRILILFLEAEKADEEHAMRYVILARKLATKYNVPLPRELKRSFCRKCSTFFIPSKTCTVRLSGQNVVYKCLACKHISRFRYKY